MFNFERFIDEVVVGKYDTQLDSSDVVGSICQDVNVPAIVGKVCKKFEEGFNKRNAFLLCPVPELNMYIVLRTTNAPGRPKSAVGLIGTCVLDWIRNGCDFSLEEKRQLEEDAFELVLSEVV